ncbi:hypothetical protein ACFOSV_00875 [Algoriphagus namhaensis]|uniref:Uncharacterized protein n=1 Tax=Algoriphagus namhaensis TaxID=915353 RepID=A0ABV8APD1_9BACT
MKNYSEISLLRQHFDSHVISFEQLEAFDDEVIWVNINIDSRSWKILIQDEYHDFSEKLPLMALFLVFSAIQDYKESLDFLQWCTGYGLNASHPGLLDYYRTLGKTLEEIRQVLGNIDPTISALDYQLRTGVIDALKDPIHNKF